MPPNKCTASLGPGPMAETISYKLRMAQLAAYRHFEIRLSRYGTAPRYLGLLAIIGHHPGQAQSRLAEAISVQRSSLVAIIDRLAEENLVERRASSVDRRANAVWLTETGDRVLAELLDEADQEESLVATGMTETDRTTLVRLLGQLVKNLS